MPPKIHVQLLPSDLVEIVESVFENMLGLEVRVGDAPWSLLEERVAAAVRLEGEWEGVVLLECASTQAARFANRFISALAGVPAEEIIGDVMGELTNMIGSNLKCVLTRGTRVTTPFLVDRQAQIQMVGADDQKLRMAFECNAGLFWVTVFEKP